MNIIIVYKIQLQNTATKVVLRKILLYCRATIARTILPLAQKLSELEQCKQYSILKLIQVTVSNYFSLHDITKEDEHKLRDQNYCCKTIKS